MRIIGGEFRSRLIEMPKGALTRPTQDRVREAVFNILGNVSEKMVLDLFAGSGALGMEAISRGATHATFVDKELPCIRTIQANLESLNIPEYRYDIIKGNALTILERLDKDGEKFDLIFLDPPYYKDLAKKCLISISSYDILSPNSFILVETSKKDDLDVDIPGMNVVRERIYGDTAITLFSNHI
jgi:16S rRNA (guanine(966)-N(2))-methyltransferase RsmD